MTISIDFDGVIHAYRKGWQNGEIYDDPMDGAFDTIRTLMKRYTVYILSTRPPEQIQAWLKEKAPDIKTQVINEKTTFWNFQGVLGITDRKIAAAVYIDDRGLRFTNWNDIRKYFG